jgi:Kre9/KNH-like N-terminal Ig-like domain
MDKKHWLAAIFVFGIGLLIFAAQPQAQQQQIKRPPIQQQIDKIKTPGIPLTGHITVTEPKSTSVPWFAGGDTNRILWTKSGIQPETVKIELRDSACTANILTIVESTANSGGPYVYVVPASVAAGTYKIRIGGTGASGCSEAIQIVPVPWKVTVPASTWKIGSTQKITWTSTQPPGVSIGLWLVPSSPAVDLYSIGMTPNDGSHAITVPGPAGSWRIRIEAVYGTYGALTFTGGGPITIIP